MIVYIDVLICVNFLITYFLLVSASVFAGYTYSRKRIIVASFAGALFCLYIFVQSENAIINFGVKVMSLIICAVIAFGRYNLKKLLIQTVCFVLLNVFITGLLITLSGENSMIYHNNMFVYLNLNPVVVVTASVVIYFVIIVFSSLKEQINPQKTYKAEINFGNFKLSGINAFYDSGFKVKDIISNKDVIFVSIDKISEKIPVELKNDLYKFLEGKYQEIKTSFVPVFFNTVTGEGVIPAIKAENLILEGIVLKNILIGFVNNKFSENVTAIFGTDIKRQL